MGYSLWGLKELDMAEQLTHTPVTQRKPQSHSLACGWSTGSLQKALMAMIVLPSVTILLGNLH